MVDFNIVFNEDLSFEFQDLSNYGSLATNNNTRLLVKYPNLTETSQIILNLFNERVSSKGDNFNFIVDNEVGLSKLIDGVYEFTFEVRNNSTVVETITKYFINDYAIYLCMLHKTDSIMDDECSDDWLQLGKINALLNIAKRRTTENLYIEAQNIINYITNSQCNGC